MSSAARSSTPRPWVVREIERKNGHVGIHVSRGGKGRR
jgi:hypothetical protein